MATALEEVSERLLAQERKKIHESSKHIYPRCEKSTGTTSYSIDFAKKEGKPASPRPCSGTRRNRPHPSQVSIFCLMTKPDAASRSFLIAYFLFADTQIIEKLRP